MSNRTRIPEDLNPLAVATTTIKHESCNDHFQPGPVRRGDTPFG